MPDPTFDEALASLQASLPENPDIDTAPQRALRVVVADLRPWLSEPVDWVEVDRIRQARADAERRRRPRTAYEADIDTLLAALAAARPLPGS